VALHPTLYTLHPYTQNITPNTLDTRPYPLNPDHRSETLKRTRRTRALRFRDYGLGIRG